MKLPNFYILISVNFLALGFTRSTQGIRDLVKRRLPNHVDCFTFLLSKPSNSSFSTKELQNDNYVVSSTADSKIQVLGNTPIALASGLHRYLTDVLHVDIWWFIGSQLAQIPDELPGLNARIEGQSIVPWRYHFNTVTFSYTSAFWSWSDWELQLDWMALRGINLPLASVGQERLLVSIFTDLGLTPTEINSFLSGPAFQAWNRFGNIQGSWGGDLPTEWIDSQFALQKQIVQRMVELGMTPVLPAFTGFVPRAITRVLPNATVVNGSRWNGFSAEYTNVTFLEPDDPVFAQLQTSFIAKQLEAYGNVTNIYSLDQYNENDPFSGDLDYLANISSNTYKSLKAALPTSIWLMQGWLFYSNSAFWTSDRISAYLSGVTVDFDMLILDLFSESNPQWQRTNSYYGKPWIWCQLHDYGGNMGMYGQIENITMNPILALAESEGMVGMGLTMEGQEGNEIVYDLLLDQAWEHSPIDTSVYFRNWVTRRYAPISPIPGEIYEAWESFRVNTYNNTNLASAAAVTKSIFELEPNISGLVNRTGHHPTTINYEPTVLVDAWKEMYTAASITPELWDSAAFEYDMTDISRQVYANAFVPLYSSLISIYNAPYSPSQNSTLTTLAQNLTQTLQTLDEILGTNAAFTLNTYLDAAQNCSANETLQRFYEYEVRNQITLWGPTGQISDYASKEWAGLVSGYYIPRWGVFTSYLGETVGGLDGTGGGTAYNATVMGERLSAFEEGWQEMGSEGVRAGVQSMGLKGVLDGIMGDWS
ncbi:hypothetical protein B7494_g5668 [Chlorociboria aeruginascens]|nr:hypothetical protein B7494_g5668 [Chlorociboria aeruginascens]